MKKKLITLAITFLAVIAITIGTSQEAHCQTVCEQGKSCVDQSFIDSSNQAFKLVVEQRKAIQEFLEERSASAVERKAATALIASYDQLIKVKDDISNAKDKIITLYENVIRLQNEIITNLEKRLLRPKSLFGKILEGVKQVLILASGILIGRGL